MDALITCVLRRTLATCKSEFGEKSLFIAFDKDHEDYSWSEGMQSKAQFGRIAYRTEEETVEHSDPLVLKVTPPFLYMKDFTILAFYNEAFFYTRILPLFEQCDLEISHMFPKYYDSLVEYNPSGDEAVIVFQNLQTRGYTQSPMKSFLDYDHLSLMMRKLGEFHAYSYQARQQYPNKFYPYTHCMLETNWIILKQNGSLAPCLMRGAEAIIDDSSYNLKCDKVLEMVNRYEEIIRDAYTDGNENNPTHVLCHGDFMRSNVLFKYDSRGKPRKLKIVDLGNWRFASPAIDISLVLYVNADQKMRDEHWDDLIDEYYRALKYTFPAVEKPSKESILEDFKTKAIVAYMIDSYFLPSLMVKDNEDLPGPATLLPDRYKNSPFYEIPPELMHDLQMKIGGETATNALTDVLKDMMKRDFL